MTALTVPATAAINLDSVTCGCCDTRWWPDVAPRFPESYVCDVCTEWIGLYQRSAGVPVAAPIKSLRKLLTGNNVGVGEFVTDASPWVLINTSTDVFDRMGVLIAEAQALNDTDPDDHIPASKVRG